MVGATNGLAARLDDGDLAIGASAATYSRTMIETFGAVGLDFVFLDYEHNGPAVWDSLAFEDVVRAAALADVEPVVRLPSGGPLDHPPLVRKVLDTGVRNVVIPRVETAESVRRAVEGAKFAYDGGPGERGVGATRGSEWGAAIDADWMAGEDATTRVGLMIENATAVGNLDAILDVPDLGFVFVGSNDLSVSLGCPLDFEHADFVDALGTIADACVDAGVPYGQLGVPLDAALAQVDRGAQLVSIGSDVGAVRRLFADRLEALGR